MSGWGEGYLSRTQSTHGQGAQRAKISVRRPRPCPMVKAKYTGRLTAVFWNSLLCAAAVLLLREWFLAGVVMGASAAASSLGTNDVIFFVGVGAITASITDVSATALTSLSVSLKPARAMMLSVSLLSTRVLCSAWAGRRSK